MEEEFIVGRRAYTLAHILGRNSPLWAPKKNRERARNAVEIDAKCIRSLHGFQIDVECLFESIFNNFDTMYQIAQPTNLPWKPADFEHF